MTLPPVRVEWLREWLRNASQEKLRHFVRFVTGNSQVPAAGFATLHNRISVGVWPHGADDEVFPHAHTCSYTIDLPDVTLTKEQFLANMDTAVMSREFGLA